MNYKLAHKIIKSKNKPTDLTNDWKIKIDDKNVLLFSEILNTSYTITFEKFIKNYFNKFTIDKDGIVGEYRFSSIGLITEDIYQLAYDFIYERVNLKRSELKSYHSYEAKNGKKYIYIEDNNIKEYNINEQRGVFVLNKNSYLNNPFLIEIKDNNLGSIIKANSVQLIEEKEKYTNIDDLNKYIFDRFYLETDGKGRVLFLNRNNYIFSIFYRNYVDEIIIYIDKEAVNFTPNITDINYNSYPIIGIDTNFYKKYFFKINIEKFLDLIETSIKEGKDEFSYIGNEDEYFYYENISEDYIPF